MGQTRKKRPLSSNPAYALNAICPYFTMFPLEFPLRILQRRARGADLVFDPFVGRGTTLFAARQRGVRAVGMDCSPVAVAIARAKLAAFSIDKTLELARDLLDRDGEMSLPDSVFWRTAFHPETLRDVCRLREGLLMASESDATVILRAAVLGVLHGPRNNVGSYLSNQMQRTFAPKPGYAIRFWKKHGLVPSRVDVLGAVERKLRRVATGLYCDSKIGWSDVLLGDSSKLDGYARVPAGLDTVITSPPYYGMRTYVSDQWLRHWFIGGPAHVEYSNPGDLPSTSQEDYCAGLSRTWENLAGRARDGMRMFIRFGCIPSRTVDARGLLLESLEASGRTWRIVSIRNAGNAGEGKRQVKQMRNSVSAVDELDVHAILE